MAEEEFEIDIYGDASAEHGNVKPEDESHAYEGGGHEANGHDEYDEGHHEDMDTGHAEEQTHNPSTSTPSQPPPQQGVKRKEGSDERPVDPGATTALLISDLSWWNTDDDIRGWVRQANCEEELKDITFSEHKVNGKSKGQAYIEFTSQQAATATKHRVDAQANEGPTPGQKKQNVIYSSPTVNPFKTLPKDTPGRAAKDGQTRAPSGPGYQDRSNNMGGGGNFSGGFRGRGGSFGGPRGGMGNQGGFNRNFSGNNMNAFNNNNNNMGFNNPMGGGNFGGFRGGMMGGGMRGGPGMRGGRGGGMNGMMGGMGPMGPMGPMGGMPGNMGGMGMMGGGMQGFQGMQPQFNPAFFGGGNQSGGNEWQNPHGAKRPRPE